MVLMNVFVEQHWRSRHRDQTYGHGRGERVGGVERIAWKHIHCAALCLAAQ